MFRKKKNKFQETYLMPLPGLLRSTSVVQEDNGETVTRIISKEVNLLDPSEYPELPAPEDYTFENLLRAGVSLREVPCANLLNPSDPANINEVSLVGAASLNDRIAQEKPEFLEEAASAPVSESTPEIVEPKNV